MLVYSLFLRFMLFMTFSSFSSPLRTPAGENEPPVKRGCTAFAAAARFDSNCRRRALEGVAETNVSIGDTSRKAYPVRLGRTLILMIAPHLSLILHIHVYAPPDL
jgi:hypothetical protein